MFLFFLQFYYFYYELYFLLFFIMNSARAQKNHKIRNEWMIQLYFVSSQSENKIQ